MDIEHPGAEERWDDDRDETEAERLDRNWSSLLQELRVTQTGVQLLTGFLLTLPFQPRFTGLDGIMRTVYLVTVACSLGATVLLVAPVSMHRVLFRRHRLKPSWPSRMRARSRDRCCSGSPSPASPSSSSTALWADPAGGSPAAAHWWHSSCSGSRCRCRYADSRDSSY